MRHSIHLFILLLLSVIFVSCDKETETYDLSLIEGKWEVMISENDDFIRGEIFDFSVSHRETNVLSGELVTYFLTATGHPLYDLNYSWRAQESVNGNDYSATLSLSLKEQSDSESDDIRDGSGLYEIIKLTPKFLWLRSSNVEGKDEVFKFRHRDDID
ncbi:MAG: hypothetical protein K2H22_04015, partial [Muribaculaceae bacterium]|nr:hypothetical protein [Muribaculaceae bacterium]